MRDVLRGADNRDPRIVRTRQTQGEATANRIFVGPVSRCKLLVDYGNRRCTGLHIGRRQIATSEQRNAECPQIVWPNHLPACRSEVRGIEFSTFNNKWIAAAVTAQRLHRSEARSLYPGQRFNLPY